MNKLFLQVVSAFVQSTQSMYAQVTLSDSIETRAARQASVDYSLEHNSDYLFAVDAQAHLTNARTLRTLLTINRCDLFCIFL